MAIARTLPLPAPKPVEKILFAGESVAVCSFRCPPDDPLFADSGPSNADAIVFPRNSVRVLREGGLDRVISVNEVSFYRQGESYRRRDVDGKGTICNWYVLAPAVLREMLGLVDPVARDDERPRFPAPIAPADARSFAQQRRIVRHVEENGPVDALWVEESVLSAVGRVLAAAAAPANLHEPLPARQTELAEDAKLLLAATATENLPLAELARRLGTSEFHLARVFRRHTGASLHQYRNQLRLRMSLERLLDGDADLATIAVDLGYSHHSHFTTRFRRAFGVTPSAFRNRRTT